MGFAFHPSNLTSSGSQSFAESQGDSKGRSPWRAFGDFPRDGKVTRGGGAERPPGGCRDYCPAKAPGVEGRSALLMGAGTTVLQRPPGWRGGASIHGKERRGWGAAPPRIGEGPRVLKLLYPSRREKTTAFGRRWAVEKETAAAVKKKEQKKEQLLDTGKNRKTAPKTMLIALLYQPCRQKSSLFSKFFHPSSPMRQNPLCGNPGETGGEFL